MKSPCQQCAFSKQGAGKEPYNSLRARVCALGPVPFFCHHGLDWKDQKNWVGPILTQNCRQSGICEGWRAEVRRLAAKGWYGEFRIIKQLIAKHCLKLIDVFADEQDQTKKPEHVKKLQRMLKFLAKKDIRNEQIPL